MLKGKTTMTLNKETVMAAIQMYLDTTFKESHVVENIKPITGGSYGGPDTFEVELDDGASAAKAA